jgi:hypothetical protein
MEQKQTLKALEPRLDEKKGSIPGQVWYDSLRNSQETQKLTGTRNFLQPVAGNLYVRIASSHVFDERHRVSVIDK